jgi:tungstate transport system substrate-binding protein
LEVKMKKVLFLVMVSLCVAAVFAHTQDRRITLATTTSTDNSGLLSVLNPPFEQMTGYRVDVIAVGTGKALKLGENGDADVVLVHARAAEDKFIADGFGVNRRDVMHNDFVLVGPAKDPAGLKGMRSASAALQKLARTKSTFVSRGDDSGTHQKERILWQKAGLTPSGSWYKEAGQGMGAVLTMTNDLQGYTLTDRGTYLSMKEKLGLSILVEGDPLLYNPYGVMAVNPARHSHVNYMGAMAYIAWITSVKGQEVIRGFTKDGEVLFYPDAIPQSAR